MLAGAAMVAMEVEETTASPQTEDLPLSLARLQALLVEVVGGTRGARPQGVRLSCRRLTCVFYSNRRKKSLHTASSSVRSLFLVHFGPP